MRRFMLSAVLALAVLAALPGAALAQETTATITGGRAQAYDHQIRGTGRTAATATADDATGALRVTASAEAGRALPLLGTRSTAAATAGVDNAIGVRRGRYEVTFTYADARARTGAEAGAAASVVANSVATFTSADETDQTPRPAIDFTQVEQGGGDLVVTLLVEAPEAGSLFLSGSFSATADSARHGAEATVTGSASSTTVTVERVG